MSPLLGITLKLVSALAFTLMSAAIKSISTRYPTGEIVFVRSFFAMIPLLIWLGQDEWGDRTGLYAFLAGLVTVNAIWFRRLR